jgi:indole-3-glycerol phosphate synthase
MATILDTIIERKRTEVAQLRKTPEKHTPRRSTKRGFIKALQTAPSLGIIAEVKKASPSKGIICPDFDPVKIGMSYEKGGAHAISVLTDEQFFQGCNDYLLAVREHVSLPVIRKEFIIDPIQVEETSHIGADAMLLIAAVLDDSQMRDLYQAALDLEIDPLIEIHSFDELDRTMKLDPALVGINNRNLANFKVDINLTIELIAKIPSTVTVVSESGIENGDQASTLKSHGVKALLVGESLVKLPDPGKLIKELSC